MKFLPLTSVFASVVLALPVLAYSQNATAPDSQSSSEAPLSGQQEATLMKPARAELVHGVDANKDRSGHTVDAKLDGKVRLTNGTELPKGTMLVGKVTTDDMQQQGTSKLALRFNQARLKDGTIVPIRATIVGFFGPDAESAEMSPDTTANEIPNNWTARTLKLDQLNVVPGVDLHSKISSQNSGVFVSTKKDVKLRLGSEIQFAIAPASSGQNAAVGG